MKKIMYNEPYGMQQAVLNGSKTMTRRGELNDAVEIIGWLLSGLKDGEHANTIMYKDKYGNRKFHKCKYEVGEIIAIAQPYNIAIHKLDWANRLIYKDTAGWNNKMFVKASLMPHQQRITGIKVERLQDISDIDCLKEGIKANQIGYYIEGWRSNKDNEAYTIMDGIAYKLFPNPKKAFATLINAVSGKGYWESNPFVVVYETELIK